MDVGVADVRLGSSFSRMRVVALLCKGFNLWTFAFRLAPRNLLCDNDFAHLHAYAKTTDSNRLRLLSSKKRSR